ncbi:hypothetical protein HK097_007670 [Rhizophlyctis rosea]|uniref:Telomerase reverse transcriptase n=1 Tax=Rhizophlyctis rosea TaxID=64517 RepID=A0AAD5SD95_9FUNG|nr:hypothetical protein HK097_007670 [Rhizophlyctis rosea]
MDANHMILIRYLKPKCHAIFLDTPFNTPMVAALNVYQNLLLCAAKFYLHVKVLAEWEVKIGECEEELFGMVISCIELLQFLMRRTDIILNTIKFCGVLIGNRTKSIVAKKAGCRCGVGGLEIRWWVMVAVLLLVIGTDVGCGFRLGLHAFVKVLQTKRTLYQKVLNDLRKEMSGVEFRGIGRQLAAVVNTNLSKTLDLR